MDEIKKKNWKKKKKKCTKLEKEKKMYEIGKRKKLRNWKKKNGKKIGKMDKTRQKNALKIAKKFPRLIFFPKNLLLPLSMTAMFNCFITKSMTSRAVVSFVTVNLTEVPLANPVS